jgi:hypothetical protein
MFLPLSFYLGVYRRPVNNPGLFAGQLIASASAIATGVPDLKSLIKWASCNGER